MIYVAKLQPIIWFKFKQKALLIKHMENSNQR